VGHPGVAEQRVTTSGAQAVSGFLSEKRRSARKSFVIAMALGLLAFGATAQSVEQSEIERRGPWLVQQLQNAQTGSPEYIAITHSLEDQNFWIGFSCLENQRVYLSLGIMDSAFFHPTDPLFRVEIRFDDRVSIMIEAKYVNANMIVVDPQTSRDILIALIHSRLIAVSISHSPEARTAGSFNVQPYAPALSKIIDACVVAKVTAPTQDL
jgi:hypothetical protein